MNQLLSDDEITLIVRECARGSAINRDGSTSHRIARTIEAKIMEKLREPRMQRCIVSDFRQNSHRSL